MSDFKQQVEEAIKDAIHDALPEEIIDLTDRILATHNAELDRIAGGRPKIVCLCGSVRFAEEFRNANSNETLAGNIVLSIGCNMKTDTETFRHLSEPELKTIKTNLDALHKRKIDLADEILILNVGGYIGESTRSEIDYAIAHNKPVRYLERQAYIQAQKGS